jgi:hypothetical protein
LIVIPNKRSCVVRNLGEPREASRSLRRNNRAFGSLPFQTSQLRDWPCRELIADSCLSKNPSNSNKTRTAGNSSCTGFPSAASSNSDNDSPRSPQPSPAAHRAQPVPRSHLEPYQSFVRSCPPTLIPSLAAGKCKSRFNRSSGGRSARSRANPLAK